MNSSEKLLFGAGAGPPFNWSPHQLARTIRLSLVFQLAIDGIIVVILLLSPSIYLFTVQDILSTLSIYLLPFFMAIIKSLFLSETFVEAFDISYQLLFKAIAFEKMPEIFS